MAIGDLERSSVLLPSDFDRAAELPAAIIEPPKIMTSLPLDADILAYFQGESEPGDWQRHVNGVLRYYMETNLAREADFEADALKPEIGEPSP